jgi:transcriptional regulator with XRE-family HTH domain
MGSLTGQRIRQARTERGLTQRELARIVGCHPSTVVGIETGKQGTIGYRLGRKLEYALRPELRRTRQVATPPEPTSLLEEARTRYLLVEVWQMRRGAPHDLAGARLADDEATARRQLRVAPWSRQLPSGATWRDVDSAAEEMAAELRPRIQRLTCLESDSGRLVYVAISGLSRGLLVMRATAPLALIALLSSDDEPDEQLRHWSVCHEWGDRPPCAWTEIAVV